MKPTPDGTGPLGSTQGASSEGCNGPMAAGAGVRLDAHIPRSNPSRAELIYLVEEAGEIDLAGRHVDVVLSQIQSRMALRKLHHVDDYVRLLADSAEERRALQDTVLIGSTRFFRDEDIFTRLPELMHAYLHGMAERSPLRLWVVGCSSGEEVYSLLIVLHEVLAAREETRDIRVFATDVRDAALQHARKGQYSARACETVSSERLERFFSPVDGGYRVVRRIRDQVLWARHDVARDPPFSHIDLVSCRNLLVHFDGATQETILRRLQFSLQPRGRLLLGATESTRAAEHRFRAVSRSCRLYEKRATSSPAAHTIECFASELRGHA